MSMGDAVDSITWLAKGTHDPNIYGLVGWGPWCQSLGYQEKKPVLKER